MTYIWEVKEYRMREICWALPTGFFQIYNGDALYSLWKHKKNEKMQNKNSNISFGVL